MSIKLIEEFISKEIELDISKFDYSIEEVISSLELLFLIQEIEDRFNIKFEIQNIYMIKTLNDFVTTIYELNRKVDESF
jgi:acyl carrier protein